MNYYFGQDERGKYVQRVGDERREYVTDEQWAFFLDEARVPQPRSGERARVAITISGTLDKYEGDTLVETVQLGSETSIL